MFVCIECGHVFDEDEVAVWEDPIGEFWGASCSKTESGCPLCKGDYTEAYRCDCCDEWITGSYIKTEDDKRYCSECCRGHELGDED